MILSLLFLLLQLFHQAHKKSQIVQCRHLCSQRFLDAKKMMNVRACIVCTGVTIAIMINWRKVLTILCITNIDRTIKIIFIPFTFFPHK